MSQLYYDQQAEDFLKAHDVSLRSKFLGTRKFFPDDQDVRDVYRVVLSRKTNDGFKKFSFCFGDSLENTRLKKFPSSYSILACLEKYDPETFEDFCASFGMEMTRKTYNAVLKQWRHVSSMFNEQELELLREIN